MAKRTPSERRVLRSGPTLGGGTRPRRNRSEGFRPIKQVGVANSLGFPLMMVGVMILFVAHTAEDAGSLWYLGGGLLGLGLALAASGRVV